MLNRILLRFMTLLLAATSLSTATRATELLNNGGFETNLVGWAVASDNPNPNQNYAFGVGAGNNIYVTSNNAQTNSTYSTPYLHVSFPQEGSRSCLIILSTLVQQSLNHRLYQDITVPANTTLTISWKQRISLNNFGAITDSNNDLKVYVKNPTSGAILQTLQSYILPERTNEVRAWETKVASLGNTYAGQTIRLEFNSTVYDENAPNYFTNKGLWELDAVSANAIPPSAASVTLSGRVTDSSGKGMGHVRMRIMDMDGDVQTVLTNKFGDYQFTNVEAGQTYALDATQKGVKFINNPRILILSDDLNGENFAAEDQTTSR